MTYFVPVDIIIEILSRCSLEDIILRVSRVCKDWNALIKHKDKVLSRLIAPYCVPPIPDDGLLSYKVIYNWQKCYDSRLKKVTAEKEDALWDDLITLALEYKMLGTGTAYVSTNNSSYYVAATFCLKESLMRPGEHVYLYTRSTYNHMVWLTRFEELLERFFEREGIAFNNYKDPFFDKAMHTYDNMFYVANGSIIHVLHYEDSEALEFRLPEKNTSLIYYFTGFDDGRDRITLEQSLLDQNMPFCFVTLVRGEEADRCLSIKHQSRGFDSMICFNHGVYVEIGGRIFLSCKKEQKREWLLGLSESYKKQRQVE